MQEICENLSAELDLLMDISSKVEIDLNFKELVNRILFIIKSRSHFEGANIVINDDCKTIYKVFELDKTLYDDTERWERVKVLFGREFPIDRSTWIGQVILSKKEIYYPDINKNFNLFSVEEKKTMKTLGYTAVYSLPLVLGEKSLGALVLFNLKSPFYLTEEDKKAIRRMSIIISKAIQNVRMYNEIMIKNKTIEKKNILLKKELELAEKIQRNLMSDHPLIEGVNFHSLYKPMAELGGDFYDFIHFREHDHVGVFISDVSGHGVPAALITIMVKVLLEMSSHYKLSPSSLLDYLNSKIQNQTDENFLTAFYGIYFSDTKKFMYSRAGHPFPLLIRNKELTELKSNGTIIGMIEEINFEEKEIDLISGDKLLFYTDGLIEASNPQGIEFEEEFYSVVSRHSELSISELIDTIYNHLLKFCQKDIFNDDICMVGMEILR